MKKVLLNLTLQTTKPLGDPATVGAILDRIISVPGLKPKTFGFHQPFRNKWGPDSMNDVTQLYQPHGEMCWFRLGKPLRGLFSINTHRSPRADYNQEKS